MERGLGSRIGAGSSPRKPARERMVGDRTGTLQFATGESVLGTVLVASAGRGLRAVILADESGSAIAALNSRFPGVRSVKGGETAERLLAAVIRMIESPGSELGEPLDPGGTEFQRAVWEELRRIPAGETATYAEIAQRIGRPAAVRAVGTACGANPLAIVIPCHRVVGSNGALTGYRWGLGRKRRLLELESACERGAA